MISLITAVVHPYRGQSFIGFFGVFLKRLWLLVTGQLHINDLATDEVQVAVLAGVAVSAGIVGTFLVLRRLTMLANSLSHTILLGIVVAFLLTRQQVGDFDAPQATINLQAMALAAVLTGIVTTFLTEFLHRTMRLQEDAANGLVFTSLFALGIVLVTMFTRNVHIGLEVVMGNVDALQLPDLKLVWIIVVINVLLIALFFKQYQLTTFDPGLARSMGVSLAAFSYLLMIQVSATVVGGFRAVGVLMVLAFIVGPPLAARIWTKSLRSMLVLSALIGVVASLLGVAMARHLLSIYQMPLTTGGLVVCFIILLFVLSAGLHLFVARSRTQHSKPPIHQK